MTQICVIHINPTEPQDWCNTSQKSHLYSDHSKKGSVGTAVKREDFTIYIMPFWEIEAGQVTS